MIVYILKICTLYFVLISWFFLIFEGGGVDLDIFSVQMHRGA